MTQNSGHIWAHKFCGFVFLAISAIVPAFSQAPEPKPVAPPPVIINFVVDINTNTVNQLVQIVNRQANSGTKRVTILIASPGGDVAAGFAAYNILRSIPNIELTTFNVGNVDSAAMLLFSAGKNRYSLPGPGPRFLIHGVSYNPAAGTQM